MMVWLCNVWEVFKMRFYLYLKIGDYSIQVENLRVRFLYWDESKMMMIPVLNRFKKSKPKPEIVTTDDDFDPIPF